MSSRLLGLSLVFVAVAMAWLAVSDAPPAEVHDVVTPVGDAATPMAPQAIVASPRSLREPVPGVEPDEPEPTPAADIEPETADDLVLAGRVVSPRGAPVAGARLIAYAERVERPEGGAAHRRFMINTGDDGRFELRDIDAMKGVRAQASRDGYAASRLFESTALGGDVELALRHESTLSGVVILGGEFEPDALEVKVAPDGPTRRGQISWSLMAQRLDGEGRYRFGGLAPGRYRVEVRQREVMSWDSLAVSAWVEVGEGVDAVAPAIDLTGAIHTYRLEVVDELGAPIPKGRGTFWARDEGDTTDITVEGGAATLRTRYDEVVAWVGAPGRRTVEIPQLRGDERVVLGPAYPVRVRLTDATAVRPPYSAKISVSSGLGYDNWVLGTLTDRGPVAFDDAGEALLELTVARRHRLTVTLSGPRTDERGKTIAVRVDADVTELDVQDVVGEQVFEVTLDPTSLAEAFATLDV